MILVAYVMKTAPLGRQMGRCTEAVQTEPTTLGQLRPSQGARPDDAGT